MTAAPTRPSERVFSQGVSLKERIAALQQRTGSISPPNASPPPKFGGSAQPGAGALRDKIAQFEVKGGVPVPRGSFGLGAPPVREDPALRRTGELYGNRIASANSARYPPRVLHKESQFSLDTDDGSPVQRKRCISTSVLNSYVPDTIARSDLSSLSVSINESDPTPSFDDDQPLVPESPTRPCRRSSVSDVDAKRASFLAGSSDLNDLQDSNIILWPTTPRGSSTPPSPSRTITQEMSDERGLSEQIAADSGDIDSEQDNFDMQRDELDVSPEVISVEDTDRRHDAHQETFPAAIATAIDMVDFNSNTAADDSPIAQVNNKGDLVEGTIAIEGAEDLQQQSPTIDAIPVAPVLTKPEISSQETRIEHPVVEVGPVHAGSSSSITTPSPPCTALEDAPALDLSPNLETKSNTQTPTDLGDISSSPTDEGPVSEASSPIFYSQSMPTIVLSEGSSVHTADKGRPAAVVARSSSLIQRRSPSPIVVPIIQEQVYTELALEPTTGPRSFKAVVHGKKTHTKIPSPIDHHNQVVAPLNLRKSRQGSRRQQAAVPTSPRTPNSPDLSVLLAQAAQLEQRLSNKPDEEDVKEDIEAQVIIVQDFVATQPSPKFEVDEFGQGPPISPSLQSLISNSSNDSKRRRSKSKSSKTRLPMIEDVGIPPAPTRSSQWFRSLPVSTLSRNQSIGSDSVGDRLSRASWSSEKSSEDSSAITTPPSPTFDLVTLPLAEDQFNHPGYRLGGRRSSSISSSSVLSSPKKSPSKKLIARSSTFMSRMLQRAGMSSSTLALPDETGSISDVPRASSPSPSYRSSSRSEHGLSTTSPQLGATGSSRPISTISTSSPASVLSSTIFDAFPEVPQDGPTPPPKSPHHFPVNNKAALQSIARSQSSASKASRKNNLSNSPSWYDEENGVHHSLSL